MIFRKATILGVVVALFVSAMSAVAQTAPSGQIVGWGSQVVGVDLSGGFEVVTAGYYHSLGLKWDGSIVAWGWNLYGQCNVPEPNADFVAAAAGYMFTLGLKEDGSIVAWGRNMYGQCNVPEPNTGLVAVAAGYAHGLGLKGDGSIVAWGWNTSGQCNVPEPNTGFVAVAAGSGHSLGLKGDGSIVAWGSPGLCDVPEPNTGFVAVAAGGQHSLGLKSDGSIVAWGNNASRQCNVPAPNTGFVAVEGGGSYSLGMKTDGSIVAWGDDRHGQCDVPQPNTDFLAVVAGTWHSLGLKTDGSIVSWGSDDHGQCDVPAPNTDFMTVDGGYQHSLALKLDGAIMAWGSNSAGQCNVPAPNTDFVAVAAGGSEVATHSLGLKSDGSIVAWGSNRNGRCDVPEPNTDFVAVAAGSDHSLGVKSDGSVVAWGSNSGRQCDVPAPNTGFVAAAGGGAHSLGLKSDGSIVAWGSNLYGQCNVPAPNTGFVAVAAGDQHSLGLKDDGLIVAWGNYRQGQCDIPEPNSDFIAVAAGDQHSLGLKSDGSIVAWGDNECSQCDVPEPNIGFMAVAAGHNHSLAIRRIAIARIISPVCSGQILAGDTLRFTADSGLEQCLWDFGDGRTSSLNNPGLVSFPTPGEREVVLNAVDAQSQLSLVPDTRTITVVPDPGAIPDLEATALHIPPSVTIGEPTEFTYTVRNAGDATPGGAAWTDAMYLSKDPYLDTDDTRLGSVGVAENLAAGATYQGAMTVTLPAIEEGAYHLILSVDDEWEVLERHQLNNEFAVATDLVIPRLADGVSASGKFAASGDARYYRIDVPSGQNLFLRLDDLDDQGANEIYIRFGSLPTRGTFDYRANVSGTADQELLVPAATPGTWYIMVYGASVPGEGDFTIEATFSQLKVKGVVPNCSPSTSDAVLTISGAGFYGAMTVELVADGDAAYPADTVESDSFTQITATFAAGSVPAGVYSVRASRGGDSDTLANAFEVLPSGEAKLETNLIVPSQLGYHAPATIYVEYRNVGNASMPAPLLLVTATQNGEEGAFLTLQANRVLKGFWTSAEPEGFSHSVQILASGEMPGVLQPGESARVPVYYAGWKQPWDMGYPPFDFNLGVLTADDTTPVNWAELKDGMKPTFINPEAWEVIWANFLSEVGNTWGDYLKMLDENASYLGRLGQRVVDIGQLLAFEFMQADGLSPLRSLASAVDAAVEAPGLQLVFMRSFPEPISQRFEVGPFGRGWSHNWEYSLQEAPDGTVTIICPGGSRRTFQPDSRNDSYFPQPGDHATLTPIEGGSFTLQEPSGLLRAFRSDGKLDYVEDTNGNRITAAYTRDLLSSLAHTSGQNLQIAYNAAGRIQTITDHLGRQTTFSYDATREHLVGAQYYDGRTATYAYGTGQTDRHALAEVAFPGGTHRYFAYDAQGRLSYTSRDGDAEAASFSYSDVGKVSVADAFGHSSEFCFDHRGALAKAENALSNALYLAFDNEYNLVRLVDSAGRSYSYHYDDRGNLIRSTDPLGQISRFVHEASLNRLASVIDANANVTRYAYDTRGNLESITYADASSETWTYDDYGNPISWANRRGHAIAYDYDAAGRVTRKIYADGSHVDYLYDARGNLVESVDANGTSAFTYDEDDYLTRIEYPAGRWLAFTYDDAGHRASSLDQTGRRLDYHYDDAGRLGRMTDETGTELVHYAYDAAGQLATLVNRAPDETIISRFDYTYDQRGHRTEMVTHYGAWSYEYDDIGQLIRAVLDSTNPEIPDQDLSYVYDALGNRIRTTINGVEEEYITNNLNQYTQVGDCTYTYDLDGNLIEETGPGGTTVYTYNDEKRLVGVTRGADTWEYAYDALGNRTVVSTNGAVTHYVVDPIGLGNIVGEYDDEGNLLAHYDHGLGLLNRTDAGGSTAYYTFDALGNVSELTGDAGVIRNTYAYRPFGGTLCHVTPVSNPFEYVGQWGVMSEVNGLSYMRARYYDARIGRFTAPDPVNILGGINLYAYTCNSPCMYADITGLSGWDTARQIAGWVDTGVVWVPRVGAAVGYVLTLTVGGAPIGAAILSVSLAVMPLTEAYDQLPAGGPGSLETVVDRLEEACSARSEDPIAPPDVPADSFTERESGSAGGMDPNEKTGPAGYGEQNYVATGQSLAYRVSFENMETATAPAQVVTISDPLSTNLDWATFQWTEIGFHDQFIIVPSNTQHFATEVPMSYNGTEFEVQVEAGIDLISGQVCAIFRSIDPATGLPPSVDIGFLPPEDGTGRGQGHISYVVRPKPGLPTGTEIRNVAHISFDYQPAIATNQVDPHDPSQGTDPDKECLNTIDADPPTSSVFALPASTGSQFLVSWSGDDIGAGVGTYDVYVSDNGGDYVPWLSGTTETSDIFYGEDGHTYAFYSVAHDHVGHSEQPPSQPDAATFTTQFAEAGPNRNAIVGGIVTLDGSNSYDPGGDMLTFQWSFASVPEVSALTDADLTDVHACQPSFVPDVPGEYVVVLTVDNGTSGDSDEVSIFAFLPNVPPNAMAGEDQSVMVGALVTLMGAASFDPDDGPSDLGFAWTFESLPSVSTLTDLDIVGADTPYPELTPDVEGAFALELQVFDGELSDSDTVTVEAYATLVPPTANAGEDQTASVGYSASLDGTGTVDPDSSSLTCSWNFVSIPAGSNLNDSDILYGTTLTPIFTPDVEGDFLLRLTVSDGTGADGDNVLVTALLNLPPEAYAGEDVQILSAEQMSTILQGTGTDPNGDPLECQWYEGTVLLQDWAQVGAGGEAPLDLGELAYLPVASHTLTLEVREVGQGGFSAMDDMVLTILNSPPQVQPSPFYQVLEVGIDPIVVVGDASDFDGDILWYEWLKETEVLASGYVQTPQGGDVVPVPMLSLPAGDSRFPIGQHSIELCVGDEVNEAVGMTVWVEITDSTAPSLSPIPSVAILWPPNHKLVPVTVEANAYDNGGGEIELSVWVTSSEPPDTDGDGNTIPDIFVDSVDSTTGIIELRLRSERSGKGEERVYLVLVTATDASENESKAAIQVLAPHDRGKK